jgi:hypothetical protein
VKPYRYVISLRVFHPKMDPAEISIALQRTPKVSWKAGDSRVTPKGTPLKGLRKDSYWTCNVLKGEWPGKDLTDAVSDLVTQLSLHRSFFQQVRSEGGKVEFFVGWFFDGNSGDVFDVDLLAKLADLGIALSLDIYPLATNSDVIPGEPRE